MTSKDDFCCDCRRSGTANSWWAGAAGTRSEFNGDLVISDFVLQKGYAYASQNKGMLNWEPPESDANACPLHPVGSTTPIRCSTSSFWTMGIR